MKHTLDKIIATPFPQNFISDILGRDVSPDEVPSDFLVGLPIVLSQIVADGSRGEKIIWLRYEKGMTLTQIGQALGISKERVRALLRQITGKLFYKYHTFLVDGYAAWSAEVTIAHTPLTSPKQVRIERLRGESKSGQTLPAWTIYMLKQAGILTLQDLQCIPDDKLLRVPSVSPLRAAKIRRRQKVLEAELQAGTLLE